MGPDLTNVISNRGPAYARVFVSAGSRRMPDFDLSDAEVESLIEFLEFVDGSGRYPAQRYEILWTGAYVEADSCTGEPTAAHFERSYLKRSCLRWRWLLPAYYLARACFRWRSADGDRLPRVQQTVPDRRPGG